MSLSTALMSAGLELLTTASSTSVLKSSAHSAEVTHGASCSNDERIFVADVSKSSANVYQKRSIVDRQTRDHRHLGTVALRVLGGVRGHPVEDDESVVDPPVLRIRLGLDTVLLRTRH
ncbi:hypothetical protein L1887_49840 [Cichorium endivia]|nr:hypothetical protein L1887_49840 [Cichorium endivia]